MKQYKSANYIEEWSKLDRATFERDVIPLNKPAVIRGLVDDWAIVKAANSSEEDAVKYLISIDNHTPVYTIIGNPEINGRFFYSDDLSGTNFIKTQAALTAVLEQLYGLRNNPTPHSIAIQAASIRQSIPNFEHDNSMMLVNSKVNPTLWLGNRAIVAPHYDVHDNIACVATGRRRFTLFPPDQISNLYIGPTLNAPGGVPISMVDLSHPDYKKFPRFLHALNASQSAILEPGDAIYIPTPWWHAVESLDNINTLINYWWGGLNEEHLSPNHSLMHSMLTIAKLKPAQRESWKHYFNYLVFQESSDPKDHLPDQLNDIVTTLTPEQRHEVYQFLISKLK